jgi:hypothetical protein
MKESYHNDEILYCMVIGDTENGLIAPSKEQMKNLQKPCYEI